MPPRSRPRYCPISAASRLPDVPQLRPWPGCGGRRQQQFRGGFEATARRRRKRKTCASPPRSQGRPGPRSAIRGRRLCWSWHLQGRKACRHPDPGESCSLAAHVLSASQTRLGEGKPEELEVSQQQNFLGSGCRHKIAQPSDNERFLPSSPACESVDRVSISLTAPMRRSNVGSPMLSRWACSTNRRS